MADDLSNVLARYRDSLTPLIEGIQEKRAQLTSPNGLEEGEAIGDSQSSANSAGSSRSHRGPSRRGPTARAQNGGSTTSLEAFLSNIFYEIFIQSDDSLFEMAFSANFGHSVDQTDGHHVLTFEYLHSYLAETRAEITSRRLISQSFSIEPTDPQSTIGRAAHTIVFEGFKDGRNVSGTISANWKVVWEDDRRVIETESFILNVN